LVFTTGTKKESNKQYRYYFFHFLLIFILLG
jgi:hypothetical protein